MVADYGPLPAIFDDTIDTYKNVYCIMDDTTAASSKVVGGNGLVELHTHYLMVLTGLDAGDIHLHLELHKSEPPLVLETWDEIVDISFRAEARLYFSELLGGWPQELPDLSFQGPGDYRIRVCARGRDEAEQTYESVEFHAVYVWPGEPGPPINHQHRDTVGDRRRKHQP